MTVYRRETWSRTFCDLKSSGMVLLLYNVHTRTSRGYQFTDSLGRSFCWLLVTCYTSVEIERRLNSWEKGAPLGVEEEKKLYRGEREKLVVARWGSSWGCVIRLHDEVRVELCGEVDWVMRLCDHVAGVIRFHEQVDWVIGYLIMSGLPDVKVQLRKGDLNSDFLWYQIVMSRNYHRTSPTGKAVAESGSGSRPKFVTEKFF